MHERLTETEIERRRQAGEGIGWIIGQYINGQIIHIEELRQRVLAAYPNLSETDYDRGLAAQVAADHVRYDGPWHVTPNL